MKPMSHLAIVQSLILLLLDCTYTAFVVPIELAFDVNFTYWNWATVWDMVAGVQAGIRAGRQAGRRTDRQTDHRMDGPT
jgi:hypothetical protein